MEAQLLIVELAGPAGSGKSTLARALSEYDRKIHLAALPNIRDIGDLPFFLWNGSLLLPTFLALYRDKISGLLGPQQLTIMAILNGWHRRLRNGGLKDGEILILDQGPVYMLAELLRFSEKDLRRTAPRWWDRICKDWANVLNMIVCLDAPDVALLDRVRGREKRHGFKSSTDEAAIEFLTRFRLTQNETLSSIQTGSGGPKVICFDTSQMALSEVQERTLALFQPYMKS